MAHRVPLDVLRRYDKPGPRYTSYPTAVDFHDGVDGATYLSHLACAAERADEPLSLYLHLPFCIERCLYCGCSVVITDKPEIGDRYLSVLKQEIRRVADALGDRRRLRQVHWGGGTPSWFSPAQMRDLHGCVTDVLAIEDDAELAIEVDPRVTTPDHLETLAGLGFRRLSVGVQDFTFAVQEYVERIQSYEQTAGLLERARSLGFDSVNVDLIYGLPLQTPETFQETLDKVCVMRPERIAVYSYAHVPWMKAQQRRIQEEDLPSPDIKLELFARAFDTFRDAGYLSIGMDHFALPDDEMGRALENGTLWRNFMGYTVRSAPDMIGCGMTSIGDVAGAYVQNAKRLVDYERAIEGGGLATERGIVLTEDDRLRRHVITSLMCTMALDFDELAASRGVEATEVFASELQELAPLAEDGLVELEARAIRLTDLGRLFVRNVAMVFDARLRQARAEKPRFSRTV